MRDTDFIPRLEQVIRARLQDDDDESYTARLARAGVRRVAQKVGEEGVEGALAAVTADRDELLDESADLLYHLLVLLKAANVPLSEVMAELENRTAQSGLEEKAGRGER